MGETIITASSPADYAAFAGLVGDYVEWTRARYAHDRWFIDATFGHQSLAEELKDLSIKYGPPKGLTLLAVAGGEVRGCGAYRKIGDGICEMKRLYVPEPFQGRGLGRRLAKELIAAARRDGYTLMRLDTGNLMTEAIAMYRALGFRDCEPYNEYPPELMPYLVFLERSLMEER